MPDPTNIDANVQSMDKRKAFQTGNKDRPPMADTSDGFRITDLKKLKTFLSRSKRAYLLIFGQILALLPTGHRGRVVEDDRFIFPNYGGYQKGAAKGSIALGYVEELPGAD